MARLTCGLLSIICVVAFSVAVKGRTYFRERDPYSRASSLFQFGKSLGYGPGISDWTYFKDYDDFSSSESDEMTSEIIKSSIESTPVLLKSDDYPDSSEDEYIKVSSEAQSTENVPTIVSTSEDSEFASMTQQPLNEMLEKKKIFFNVTDKMHVTNSSLPIGNYAKAKEVSSVSTPTTLEIASYGTQNIQNSNFTLKMYSSTSATESSSSSQVRSTNSSKKIPYTVTPDDHTNATISSVKILATKNDSATPSIVPVSALNVSTNSPSVASVVNTDETISDETHSTISNNITTVVSISSLDVSTSSPTVPSVRNTDEKTNDETHTTISSDSSSSVSFSSLDIPTSSPTVISVTNTEGTKSDETHTTIFTELTSGTSVSSLDISSNRPAVISVTNTEETKSDETYTTVSRQSVYSQSSSTGSKTSSTQLVIKTTKLAEMTTTATEEEKSDIVTEATSEGAKNRSLKLIVSVVFLIIAFVSMAVLITYVIRAKRVNIQYDELTLLP